MEVHYDMYNTTEFSYHHVVDREVREGTTRVFTEKYDKFEAHNKAIFAIMLIDSRPPVRVKKITTGYTLESSCLRLQPKEGGKPHLRLNMTTRPIANKYREESCKEL
ncbi:hypothetical protein DINM_000934 [Dirofilaria immitis]|nr:hypothetical protein [Dirofilaria immitis]